MKKEYTTADCEIIYFSSEDIMTTSGLAIDPNALDDDGMGLYEGEI